jgi:hypothetical protein
MRIIAFVAWLALALACGPEESAPGRPAPSAAGGTPGAAEVAPAPLEPPASALAPLRELVGAYPHQVDLWDRPPLAERLRALLGPRFEAFLGNMDVVGPLREEDGVLYVTGNKQHQGGTDAAALVIDLRQDVIWAWLLVGGRPEAVAERDVELVVPEDVRMTIENAETLPSDEPLEEP